MASSPLSIEQYRAKLLELAAQADPYLFLSNVDAYLAAVPHDEQIRAAAVGALLRKGLNHAAEELASGAPVGSELRQVALQLQRLPSEILNWDSTESRFRANLDALRTRGDREARLSEEIARAWDRTGPSLTLHHTNDGNLQVRGMAASGRRAWMPAALDFLNTVEVIPEGEAAAWKGKLPPPFLVDSVGMGWLVTRLHASTQRTYLNYSPAIFVVETSLPALAIVLRLHDWSQVLADPRVYLFGGGEAWEQWRELMRAHPGLNIPRLVQHAARWTTETLSPAGAVLQRVEELRDQAYKQGRRRAEEIYAGRDVAYWARRYASLTADKPLRVLGLTSRYTTYLQHSTIDSLAAFERAGAKTMMLIEDRDHGTIPPQAYMEAFCEFQPDLVLVLDHHRYEYAARFIQNVPFVCWIQDELMHLFSPDVGSHLGPLDFTIGFGLTQCVTRAGYPVQRFMPCRTVVSVEKLGGGPPRLRADYRCDVAYISHASETPAALHARVRELAGDPEMQRLIDAFYEGTRELFFSERFNGAYDLDALLARIEQSAGVPSQDPVSRDRLMGMFIRPLVDRSLRHATLQWVADWADGAGRRLHVYGNGWDRHPRFGQYAQGPAQHGEHLGQIAREAAINIHTGLNPALHQRVLEVLGAGGFLMVRYHPFDFAPPAARLLQQYIETHGIHEPTRIPMSEMPPEYLESVRERSALRGVPIPESVDITREWLIEQSARRFWADTHTYADQAFPRLSEIAFRSPEEFAKRAEHFLTCGDERIAIAAGMHEAVANLFTYDALIPRVVQFITDAFAQAVGCETKPASARKWAVPPVG